MILFVGALPAELKTIKSEVKKINSRGLKVDFLLTGVGSLNVVYSVKDYISKNKKPDFIVNLGTCGKKDPDFDDFFQVYRIRNLSNNKEVICPIYIKNNRLKSILCSDKVITDKKELISEEFIDMESFGIDYICDKEKIPYVIIKKPFDVIGEGSKNVNISELVCSLRGFDYQKLINNINNFLLNNKKNGNYDEIILELKQRHKLTFSETELLKKYINKLVSFGKNFEDVVQEVKGVNTEELLEKIKN